MKKAISLLLAMAMSVSIAAVAMADAETTEETIEVTATEEVKAEGTEAEVEVEAEETEADAEAPAELPEAKDFSLLMQINNPNMIVNEVSKEIDPGMGTVPVIKNDRTLVPVAVIVEEMGGTVAWDDATKTATLALDGDVIKLTIGSATAYLNDEAVELDVTPEIINDRTMLPIRFIAESFKFAVLWDGEMQTIIIIKNAAPAEADKAESEAPAETTDEADKADETVDAEETTEETPVEDTEETTEEAPVEEEK